MVRDFRRILQISHVCAECECVLRSPPYTLNLFYECWSGEWARFRLIFSPVILISKYDNSTTPPYDGDETIPGFSFPFVFFVFMSLLLIRKRTDKVSIFPVIISKHRNEIYLRILGDLYIIQTGIEIDLKNAACHGPVVLPKQAIQLILKRTLLNILQQRNHLL